MRYDPEGNVLVDSRENPALSAPGPVLWSAPLPPHALENVGAADMHVISFEVKNTPR